jgi:hypothetical protein
VREREIQKQILVALSRRFHPRGIFWTCDTGQFIPVSEIRRATAEIAREAAGGRLSLQSVRSILSSLRRMAVGLPGQSDIQGCLCGRAVYIEVKTATGRQRTDQRAFEAAVTKAGGIYIVARSHEDAVEQLLVAFDD